MLEAMLTRNRGATMALIAMMVGSMLVIVATDAEFIFIRPEIRQKNLQTIRRVQTNRRSLAGNVLLVIPIFESDVGHAQVRSGFSYSSFVKIWERKENEIFHRFGEKRPQSAE